MTEGQTPAPESRDGVVLIDKPAGPTSHEVVAVARKAIGVRRIGHAGTLDPFATGLLVLLVGRATRLLPYLDAEPKVYDATIQFGAETDTDDSTGQTVREAPPPAPGAVRQAITALTGEIDQVPPAYSAKKVDGRRAYDAAREGTALSLAPVRVTVARWTIRAQRDDALDVEITCSGGTYIRALARDLGRLAGSAAHLAALRRVRSGPFHVGDAQPIDRLRAGDVRLLPPLAGVASLPTRVLEDAEVPRAVHGNPVPASGDAARVALIDSVGALVGVADRHDGMWQPKVVLRDA
jgi:tRNA pseudouridine55 synthase